MAAWNSVIVIIVLFGLNCNGQFIPGQQLNAHEQVENGNVRASSFRANSNGANSQALYHQQTHLSGEHSGRDHHAIPALRAPIQPIGLSQPAAPIHVKSSRKHHAHIAAAKALETSRRPAPIVHINENTDELSEDDEERLLREQKEAQSAHYTFDSSIQDTINDHAIVRQETRDGLALKGMYSYSDGFYTRTVHYEADEGGYRVVKEEIQPIGDGPKFNPKGKADITSSLHPSYSITAEDFIKDPNPKRTANELENKFQ